MASNRLSDQDAWTFFYNLFGGNAYAAAGACGNMMHESGLYTDNAENAWNNKTGHSDEWLTERINNCISETDPYITLSEFLQKSWWVNSYGFGYGLSQWTTTSRRTELWNRTIALGIHIDDHNAQLEYIRWEFNNGWSSVRDKLMNATSVEQATRIYCSEYEGGAWSTSRLTYASNFYDTFAGSATGYEIRITVDGNGYADASVNERVQFYADAGDTVTIWARPNDDDYFLLWTVETDGVTLLEPATATTNRFIMPAKRVFLTAHFTGETPEPTPPPEPPPYIGRKTKHHMPIWMYPMFRV